MPLFHFYLVDDDEREHVGSMELPSRGGAVPVGLHLVARIMATSASRHGGGEGLRIQATDEADVVIYSFGVQRRPRYADRPRGYVH